MHISRLKVIAKKVYKKFFNKKNHQLRMVLQTNEISLHKNEDLPEGFYFRTYDKCIDDDWIKLFNENEHDFGIWDIHKLSRKVLPYIIHDGTFFILRDKKIVGCVSLAKYPNDLPAITLSYVLVEKNYRNIGLGRKLLKKAILFAKEKDYQRLILRTDPSRIPAIKLYLSMGFQPFYKTTDEKKRWDMLLSHSQDSDL